MLCFLELDCFLKTHSLQLCLRRLAREIELTQDIALDVDFCRSHFPELAGDWIFMENAGGTLVPRQVIDRLNHYAGQCQVQPGAGYPRFLSDSWLARRGQDQVRHRLIFV